MAAAEQWYQYPIPTGGSHAHGDDGDDIDTPNDTPLWFPYGGQVIDASYHVYGGQVVVHMPDGYDEYFIHLNHIDVAPGESVTPGQEIGTSGGGVGDLILKNGHVQPATSQADYQGHSSGYHTELGMFADSSAHGDMNQFNQGWGNHSRQLDPTTTIAELNSGILSATPSAAQVAPGVNVPDPTAAAQTAVSNAITNAVSSFGFSSPQNALQRIGVGLAGAAVIFVGLYIVAQPEQERVNQFMTSSAAKIAKVAAL